MISNHFVELDKLIFKMYKVWGFNLTIRQFRDYATNIIYVV